MGVGEMERVEWGNLPDSSRMTWIERLRTKTASQPGRVQSINAELTTPGSPQLRRVLIAALAWLAPPRNAESVTRSTSPYYLGRSFSTWK